GPNGGRPGRGEKRTRRPQATPHQSGPQQCPAALEPRFQGALAHAQLGRRLVQGPALEVAKRERGAVSVGGVGQFLVQDLLHLRPSAGDASGRAVARSCLCRRANAVRARRAVRYATPCSQLASEADLRIDPALRAKIRNVAWKASSASASLGSSARQTASTIG